MLIVVRDQSLNTVLEVWSQQCHIEGDNHFSSPAGCAVSDLDQYAIGLLGHLGILLSHIHQLLTSSPRSFSARHLSSHSFPSLCTAAWGCYDPSVGPGT